MGWDAEFVDGARLGLGRWLTGDTVGSASIPTVARLEQVASYGCRELIEMGVVDILQTDINHVGGITALWKVAACADSSQVSGKGSSACARSGAPIP